MNETLHTSFAELTASIRALHKPYEEAIAAFRKVAPSLEQDISLDLGKRIRERVVDLIKAYRVTPEVEKEAEFRIREANRAKEKLLASEGRRASKVLLFDALMKGVDPLAGSPEELAVQIKEIQQWAIEKCAVCGRAIMRYPYCDRCQKDTVVTES